MPNYFDYILEESTLPETKNIDLIFNEYDLTMTEFDTYVQEGVGLKILAGVGFAAMLGGLIAVIIELVSGKSDKSTAVKAKKAEKMLKDKMKDSNNEEKTARFEPGELVSFNGFKLLDAAVIMEEMCVDSFEKTYEMETEFIEGLGNGTNEKAQKDYEIWVSNRLLPHIQKTSSEYMIKMKNTLSGTGISAEDFMSGRQYNAMNTEAEVLTLSDAMVQIRRIEDILNSYSRFGKRLNVLQKKFKEREKRFPQFKEGTKQSQEFISAAIKNVEDSKNNMNKMIDTILNKF